MSDHSPGQGSGTPHGSRPARVRVTGPQRRRATVPRAATQEIDAGTTVGAVYMSSLLREQRRLAVRVVLALALTIGIVPLAWHLLPRLGGVVVLGAPLAWVLLAAAVHPLLLALGWYYVRRAEANERDFADLVGEAERDDPDGRWPGA